MNDTFDIKRFSALFKKLLYERSLHFIGSFILTILFSWFVYHGGGDIKRGWHNQDVSFSFGLMICGIYWVSVALNYFSNKEEAYSFLTLPASHFEKWLSVFTFFILFCITYGLFFSVLDTVYYTAFKNYQMRLGTALNSHHYQIYNLLDFKQRQFEYIFFFNLAASMAVGALYFNKMALVKTMLLMIGFFIVLMYLHGLIVSTIYNGNIRLNPFWGNLNVHESNKEIISLSLGKPLKELNILFYMVGTPAIFWLIAYIRLKEKEI